MLSQKQKSIKNTIVYLFFMLLTIIAAVISDNTHYLKLTAVFMIIAAYYIYRLIRKKDSTEKPKDKLKKQLKKTEIGKKTLEKISEKKIRKTAYKDYIASVEDEFSDDIFLDAYNKEDE